MAQEANWQKLIGFSNLQSEEQRGVLCIHISKSITHIKQ